MTPEPPDTPFPSGAPYWYWLGGRPALDFVNTRRERWRGDIECLRSPADLAEWLRRAGMLEGEARASRVLLGRAVELREAIDAGVRACVAGDPLAPAAVETIDGWLSSPRPRVALLADLGGGPPRLGERDGGDPLRAALGAVALDAARLLGRREERARLRICGSETCSARFYDRSPAARRRWCSMALCGNVEKARRHRARAAD